jgi:hypothetical protein
MPAPRDAVLALQFARLFRRGEWTNDPKRPNYENHWNAQPLQSGETVREVYPVVQPGLPRTYKNVRVTDENVYVDTPKFPPAVGAVARPAKTILDLSGRLEPVRIPRGEVEIQTFPEQAKVQITGPGLDLTGDTNVHVGSPGDLSPMQQLGNAWRFARGPRE